MENQSKNVDYIQLLKDAWKITWENKFLWWFGFLITLGGGGMSGFNFSGNEEEVSPEVIENINYYWSMYREWIIAGIVILFLIILAFYFLSIIGRGGLIVSLVKIGKSEEVNFSSGFKEGRSFFWKLFLLNLVFGGVLLFIVAVLSFPIARLVYLEAYGAATLLGLVALPIIISVFILATFLKIYSQIYLVGNKVQVFDSIRLAYSIFKGNIKGSILMGITLMIVGIIFGFALLMAIFVLTIPFIIIGLLCAFTVGMAGAISVAILGVVALIIFAIVWRSVYTVFIQAVWILFFNKIAISPNEEKEKLEEKIEEKVPELGKA